MKTVIAILVVLASACCADAQAKVEVHQQKMLLKNWALSRCLGQVFSDADTKEDAFATASAYLESGHQPAEAYEALTTLVNKYAARKYSGAVRSEFNTMKCIDLYNSNELDQLAKKLSKVK